jgi:hypothetical protein
VDCELTAAGPADHQVEFDLAVVLEAFTGCPHTGDDAVGPGSVPDQLELVDGEKSLVDEHLIEGGADRGDGADAEVGRGSHGFRRCAGTG